MKEGLLKRGAFHFLRGSGLLALAERRARGVPLLAYHGVTAGAPLSGGALHNRRRLHIPRALFAAHLERLAARQRPMSLAEVTGSLAAGQPPPPGAVVLTFDDGYRNLLTQALPLLRAHGIPATLFVVTSDGGRPFWEDRLEAALEATPRRTLIWDNVAFLLDSPRARQHAAADLLARFARLEASRRDEHLARLIDDLGGPGDCDGDDRARLSWDELRALRDAGVTIGAHADRHEPLTARDPGEAAAALVECRRVLERELGTSAPAFSYPYGARDARLAGAVRAAGFTCAVTGRPRRVRPGDDLYQLGRFLLGADDDLTRLRAALCGLRGAWQRDPWPPRS